MTNRYEHQRPATTGWALKQLHNRPVDRETCECGAQLCSCAGCGESRCLTCDPYLSDDCRWVI